jgi:hypothetical protein
VTDRLGELIAALRGDADAQQLADALWLATHLAGRPTGDTSVPGPPAEDTPGADPPARPETSPYERLPPPSRESVRRDTYRGIFRPPAQPAPADDAAAVQEGWAPSVPALPDKLELVRALRPLRRTAPSPHRFMVDEQRTAENVAELDLWLPVLNPQPQAWLDLALVTDTGPSMRIWSRTIEELVALFERLGAFRTIRRWRLDSTDPNTVRLTAAGGRTSATGPADRDPGEIVDPTGNRLVLIATDCVGPAWRDAIGPVLERWGHVGPVAILQMLPQRLWHRCPATFTAVRWSAPEPRLPNARLGVEVLGDEWDPAPEGVAVPVVELSPRWLAPWSSLVAGALPRATKGVALFTRPVPEPAPTDDEFPSKLLSPRQRLQAFQSSASPTGAKLAAYLAAAPLNLQIMRVVQASLLPESRPGHLAEVFLGGLLQEIEPEDDTPPDEDPYEFHDGVRELLLATLTRTEAIQVLRRVSAFLSVHAGNPHDLRVATAAIDLPTLRHLGRPFAQVAVQVLRAVGTPYNEAADVWSADLKDLPFVDRRTVRGITEADDVAELPVTTIGEVIRGSHPRAKVLSLPSRNPYFIGRQALLQQIQDRLPDGPVVLLPTDEHQLGGTGRVQVAAEYAHRHADDYDLVWWVPAEQISTVRTSLVSLAAQLRIPETGDVGRTLEAVRDTLSRGTVKRWLLVFENANRPESLIPYLPSGGHLLITSRSERWPGLPTTALRVGPFSRGDSVDFVLRRLPDVSRTLAERLATSLRDEPMALEQATAYITATGTPVAQYLRTFDEQDRARDRSSQLLVTWRLCLEELQRTDPGAVQMLELAPFLASTPVSVPMLLAGLQGRGRTGVLDSEKAVRRAIADLARYGLAAVDHRDDTVQIHHLVQGLTLLHHVPADAHVHHTNVVRRLLATANPQLPDDPRTWRRYSELGPHLVHSDVAGSDDTDVRQLLVDQVRYLYLRGDFHGSAELSEQAYARWAATSGHDDLSVLTLAFHLANSLRATGEIRRARNLNQETLHRQQRVCGADSDAALATANSVGADLRLAGRFTQAFRLDSENLVRHQAGKGAFDPATLRCANNLAVDLRLLSRFQEALDLDEQTLRQRRTRLAPGSPETFSSILSVALDLYYLGRYADADHLLTGETETHRAQLGADHPMALFAGRYQAMIRQALGRYDEARDLAADTWALTARRLGEDSVAGVGALVTLANCYRVVGEAAEASTLLTRGMERYVGRLGADHPLTFCAQVSLALACRAAGRGPAAHTQAATAHHGLRTALGPGHLFTVAASVNLSTIRYESGGAAPTRNALHAVLRYLGEDHDVARVARHNFAAIAQARPVLRVCDIEPPPL